MFQCFKLPASPSSGVIISLSRRYQSCTLLSSCLRPAFLLLLSPRLPSDPPRADPEWPAGGAGGGAKQPPAQARSGRSAVAVTSTTSWGGVTGLGGPARDRGGAGPVQARRTPDVDRRLTGASPEEAGKETGGRPGTARHEVTRRARSWRVLRYMAQCDIVQHSNVRHRS